MRNRTVGRAQALLCAILLTMTLLPGQTARAAVPEPEEILAEAAVLMDAETGQILYEKNAYSRMYPASITKIMTGMLAMEHLEEDRTLTAGSAAVDIPSWGSSAYIRAGERLTVEQLLYAMMLRSANEAANILAEGVAGTMEEFTELMNSRARELGAGGTHFSNANGLPARDHYTTARDMALITRQAVQTPGFLTCFGADSYSMPTTGLSGAARTFTNTHRMLLRNYGVYSDEVLGGKTGYTVQAGYTLATVAERYGRTLICIVLKSSSYYQDTQRLLDFGFEEFSPHTWMFRDMQPVELPVVEGELETGIAYLYHPVSTTIYLHESVMPSDVLEELAYPEALRPGEDSQGEALLRLTSPQVGLPEVLMTLPLQAEVTMFQPMVLEAMLSLEPESGNLPLVVPVPAAAGVAAVSGAICLRGIFRAGTKRRRFRRRAYRNRRQVQTGRKL